MRYFLTILCDQKYGIIALKKVTIDQLGKVLEIIKDNPEIMKQLFEHQYGIWSMAKNDEGYTAIYRQLSYVLDEKYTRR